MWARLAVAPLLAVALLAAGCGGGGNDSRQAVSEYISRVNRVEARLARPLLEVAKANRDFAAGGDPAQLRARLAASQRTLRTLERRLDALAPPPEAAKLHRLLLELVRRERSLAAEVAQLAAFMPAFSDALKPLAAAADELRRGLAAPADAAKAEALDRYAAALAPVARRLRRLQPPPAAAPAYRTQLATIDRVRAAVTELATALREGRGDQLPRLVHQLDLARVSNQTLAAQRAQRAAVRAYNARVRSLDTLTARINRERTRLQGATG